MHYLAYSVLGDADEADDAVQETIIRALGRIERYQPGSNMKAWLSSIVFNQCRDMVRRRKARSGLRSGLAWFTISSLSQDDSASVSEPPTEITLAPTEQSVMQPIVTPTEIPLSPTAEATEQPTVGPTATLDPSLAYQSYDVGDQLMDLTVADFNGDAFPDIALPDYDLGATYVLLNDGNGNYPEVTTYDTGEGTITIADDDLNGDSWLDLAIALEPDWVGVMFNNGDGTFQESADLETGGTPREVKVAELNGDGPDHPEGLFTCGHRVGQGIIRRVVG